MEIVLRSTLVFWLLWLITRGTGKRELAQLSAFDLVLVVVLGDIVQQAVTQEDYSITGAVLATTTISAWVVLLSIVQHHLPRSRRVLTGQPVVLVWRGAIQETALDHERVSHADLREAARSQGIEDLASVDAAVLEADGAISFVRPPSGDVDTTDSETGPASPNAQ
jgi:uncharacterized membrane protein YcaP (DUF421 family)